MQATIAIYEKSQWLGRGETGFVNAYAVGCIGYRDQFEHLYHTSYIYALTNQFDANTNRGTPGTLVEFLPTPNTTVQGKLFPLQSHID